MNKLTVKALVAVAAVAATASASATQVYLNQAGLRSAGGTLYSSANPVAGPWYGYNGADGSPASTATFDWTGGVLTMTGGFLQINQRVAPSSTGLLSDVVTGLVINTNTGTTTATSYMCLEGPFGGSTGANSCANTSYGGDFINDSSVAYNVGGDASCEIRTIGNDDSSGTPPVFRGLRSWAGGGVNGCGDNSGRGALDMVQVLSNTSATLILANWNGPGTTPSGCVNPGSASAADPSGNVCGRAHYLVFSDTVPVPAAVWLFGSAVGLLGWVRRRARA